MKTNQEGINLIKHFEGLHDGDLKVLGLQPKMDPIGIWTEGYGRAMRDAKGKFIKGKDKKNLAYSRISITTEVEAELALAQDLQVYENIVSRKVKIDLTENQFSALVSYTYNTGGSSTLFRLINTKAPIKEIQSWFKERYITADGVIFKGLVLRRKAECSLYFTK
jgi:lysozyme